jgi:hypothetical protein
LVASAGSADCIVNVPLIVDVESSQVLNHPWKSTPLLSSSSRKITPTEAAVALLNLNLPVPGSSSVVDVLNV